MDSKNDAQRLKEVAAIQYKWEHQRNSILKINGLLRKK